MRTLCIQFQPDRLPSGSEARVLDAVKSAIPNANVASGDDDGRYVNITFDAKSPLTGWRRVSNLLHKPDIGHSLRRCSIVVCQGQQGWDDYLLLHHYDRRIVLDNLRAAGAARLI